METLKINNAVKNKSNTYPGITLKKLNITLTNDGLFVVISSSFLQKNNYKIEVIGNMLRIAIMTQRISHDKGLSSANIPIKNCFWEGTILLPGKNQKYLKKIKYHAKQLMIQIIEKPKINTYKKTRNYTLEHI